MNLIDALETKHANPYNPIFVARICIEDSGETFDFLVPYYWDPDYTLPQIEGIYLDNNPALTEISLILDDYFHDRIMDYLIRYKHEIN